MKLLLKSLLGLFLISFCILSLPGCGKSPAEAKVSGTVTLDGNPVANAEVTFTPEDGSRISQGVTDSEGRYVLRFTASLDGAAVGTHNVTIRTGSSESSDDPEAAKEIIPAKYNTQSELKETVKAGKNVVDFKLTSE